MQRSVDVLLPPSWQRRIAGTAQKTYRVSETLAIGWAGSRLGARRVIAGLFDAFAGKVVSLPDLRTHLATFGDYEDLIGDMSCRLTGWLIDSGRDVCILWDDVFYASHKAEEQHPAYGAISKVGLLIGHEIGFGRNISKLFGGGFDVIIKDQSRLQYLHDVTYLSIHCKEVSDGMDVKIAPRAVKHERRNGLTYYLAVETGAAVGKKHELHLTLPIHIRW